MLWMTVVVHCDIRPENIMRCRPHTEQDKWVLCNFSSATRLGEGVDGDVAVRYGRVHTLPPELATAYLEGAVVPAEPPIDMWGLGYLLYFLTTSFPFWRKEWSDTDILYQLHCGNIHVPTHISSNPAFPIMKQVLKHQPRERWRLDRFRASNVLLWRPC
jgi:serine/threonine protein kinase